MVQLALDAEMSYLTGKGVELAAKLYGIEIAKDIVSGGKTYNSNVAARNAAQEAYYNASDPGDKVIQGEKVTAADKKLKAGVANGIGKMFVGAATDEIFARYPSVQAAYETASALRRDPVCGVFRTQTQGMAAAARALAAELRANSTAAGLRFMALDSSIETAGIPPADLVALTSDVTSALAALDATPGSYLPDDADTDRAFTSIISAFGAVSNLLEASDPLVDDSNRVDAIGPLAASLDDYRSWSGLLPSLGAEVRRSSLSDGIATHLPLADAEDVAELQRAQQFLRDNPLTAAERQALIDAGADDDLIDAAVAAVDGLDIGILTTTTASQLDDSLTSLSGELVGLTENLSTNLRVLPRSAVARPDRGGRLRHHRSRHSGRHHTARVRRAGRLRRRRGGDPAHAR